MVKVSIASAMDPCLPMHTDTLTATTGKGRDLQETDLGSTVYQLCHHGWFLFSKMYDFPNRHEKNNNNLKATSGTNPSHSAGGDKA